jgi:hypothetical protein
MSGLFGTGPVVQHQVDEPAAEVIVRMDAIAPPNDRQDYRATGIGRWRG